MPQSPEEFYSDGAEQFAENYTIENLPDQFMEFIDSFIHEVGSGRVLDAGCGPGRDVDYFIQNGLDAVGIDLAEGMIEYARENMRGEYHLMDVTDIEFEDNSFDAAYSNTVLIFLKEDKPVKAIREMKRVTEEDAPIYLGLKIGEKDFFVREKYGDEVEQRLFDKEEIHEMLEQEDLETVDEMTLKTDEEFDFYNLICRKQ